LRTTLMKISATSSSAFCNCAWMNSTASARRFAALSERSSATSSARASVINWARLLMDRIAGGAGKPSASFLIPLIWLRKLVIARAAGRFGSCFRSSQPDLPALTMSSASMRSTSAESSAPVMAP
jgi:hypothetical protein